MVWWTAPEVVYAVRYIPGQSVNLVSAWSNCIFRLLTKATALELTHPVFAISPPSPLLAHRTTVSLLQINYRTAYSERCASCVIIGARGEIVLQS